MGCSANVKSIAVVDVSRSRPLIGVLRCQSAVVRLNSGVGAIVNSLVGDIMSPIIGAVTGGFDFSNYFLPLPSKVTATSLAEARKQGAVLAWGSFLTVVINFIIIAWVLFLVVKLMNRMMQSEAPKAPALTKQETLLTEIRDLLKREQR